jgi:hypothetical protein
VNHPATLQSSPDSGSTEKVKQTLLKLNFVADLHHFHLWSLDGESHVLTVYLSLDECLDIAQQEALKLDIKQYLAEFKLNILRLNFSGRTRFVAKPSLWPLQKSHGLGLSLHYCLSLQSARPIKLIAAVGKKCSYIIQKSLLAYDHV